jgi:hypothetical protein
MADCPVLGQGNVTFDAATATFVGMVAVTTATGGVAWSRTVAATPRASTADRVTSATADRRLRRRRRCA